MVCIDTQFESNKLDNRFNDWANNGITAVCNIIYKIIYYLVLKKLKKSII